MAYEFRYCSGSLTYRADIVEEQVAAALLDELRLSDADLEAVLV